MDKLTKEEVLHVAKLANITVNDDEIENYQITLKKVLNEIEKINEIIGYDDNKMISPCTNLTTFREDNSGDMLKIDEVMKNVPVRNGNFIETVGVINE